MKTLFPVLISLLIVASCNGQKQKSPEYDPRLIGNCEGCEAVFEYGDRFLSSVDTLPDFNEKGQKIKVSGTIYEPDGKTPAEDVIMYVYHTNQEGLYKPKKDSEGWARKHGYIRGWMKTGKDGRYEFYTLRPAAYPSRSEPAHIHPIILEPDGRYYWLEGYFFDDDPLLTKNELNPSNPRGGSNGVLNLKKQGDLWVGERDFILGKNIEGYE